MVRFVAIDDKPMHNRTLVRFLETFLEQESVDAEIALITTSQGEVLEYARNTSGHTVYFLDIEYSADESNGISLSKEIQALDSMAYIIFVSAYQSYALACCQSHAFDFIVKPFTQAQFTQCLRAVLADIQRKRPPLALVVQIGSRTCLLDQANIHYLAKSHVYITAHSVDGLMTWRQSFRDLLPNLHSDLFVQIHRSYCVNRRHVRIIDWGADLVHMVNGDALPIARRMREAVRSTLISGVQRVDVS